MWKVRVAGAWLAGVMLLLGAARAARAGDFFRSCAPSCDSSCPSEVVKIPGHQIVVETARPQVVVNETRVVHAKPQRVAAPLAVAQPLAFAPAPMVATIYTPMALPLAAPMPHVSTVAACPPPPRERTSLDALHDLEYHSLEVQKLQAARDIEMKHTKDAFKRISGALQSSLSSPGYSSSNGDGVQSDLRAEVARLTNLVNGSTDRTTQLEKVIKDLQTISQVHDEVIKNKVLQGGSPGCGSTDVKNLESMIRELQQLVLKHDNVLQELVRQRRVGPPPGPLMPQAAEAPPK